MQGKRKGVSTRIQKENPVPSLSIGMVIDFNPCLQDAGRRLDVLQDALK